MKKEILLIGLLMLLTACTAQGENIMNTKIELDTTEGRIVIELFTEKMPITAGNFQKLVEEGFYDGLTFHRVIPNFMIQGGDPNGDGTGGPGYTIKDEFVDDSDLSNKRGTLSMANAGPNSGGSQFFINTADNIFLDWNKPPMQSKHPVFGKVIEGMDIVDKISMLRRDAHDKLLEEVVIKKAEVI